MNKQRKLKIRPYFCSFGTAQILKAPQVSWHTLVIWQVCSYFFFQINSVQALVKCTGRQVLSSSSYHFFRIRPNFCLIGTPLSSFLNAPQIIWYKMMIWQVFFFSFSFQINSVQALAKCTGWQVLSSSTYHLGCGPVEPLGNATGCLLANSVGDKFIAVRIYNFMF